MPYLSAVPDAPVPTETAVTVLYPFVKPSQVDDHVVSRLAAALQPVSAFGCRFARTSWFGEDVFWLDPEPSAPFRNLTAAVGHAFPEHPPYAGVHDVVVPHLTVGERRLSSLPKLQAAELDVQAETAQVELKVRERASCAPQRLV